VVGNKFPNLTVMKKQISHPLFEKAWPELSRREPGGDYLKYKSPFLKGEIILNGKETSNKGAKTKR
jgi:hypothetical protein